jgi:hypothetical protein
MGKGLCERFNRTLINMLGSLEQARKADWMSFIDPIVDTYNCMKQETTKFSPYHPMSGREPNLPIYIEFGLDRQNERSRSLTKYVDNMNEQLRSWRQRLHVNCRNDKRTTIISNPDELF